MAYVFYDLKYTDGKLDFGQSTVPTELYVLGSPSWNGVNFHNTFDKETQRAVKAWQVKNGLSPTGYLTKTDYDKLLTEYKKKEVDLFKIFDNPQLKEGGNHASNKKINYWLDNTIGDNKYTEKLKSQTPDGTELGNYTSKFTADTSYLINEFQKENQSAPYYLKKTNGEINAITLLVLKKKFEQKGYS